MRTAPRFTLADFLIVSITMIIYHPHLDDDGRQVALRKPSLPTEPHCWLDPELAATVLPGGAMPDKLNRIAIAPWHASGDGEGATWAALAGPADAQEPPFTVPPGYAGAAGAVIVEDDGRVWLVAPSNQFGGYAATFPKGRIDAGDDPRCAAVREAYEESGLKVHIDAFLTDALRTQTYTRYYLARRVGGTPAGMGWESQAVHLVPMALLGQYAAHPHDAPVIAALRAHRGDQRFATGA